MKKEVPFTVSWITIATSAIFCFYAAQLLIIVADSPSQAEAFASNLGGKQLVASSNNSENKIMKNMVTLKTNKGDISIELYANDSPKTVENFLKLVNSGFYNGVKFHRVISGFMIQAGDPLTKDDGAINRWGTGGPGYTIPDELTSKQVYQEGYKAGVLAMANTGRPNSGGSQFFIMHKDYPLPPQYTIFGKVTSGMEVVNAIASVKTYMPGQVDRPLENVVILKAEAN